MEKISFVLLICILYFLGDCSDADITPVERSYDAILDEDLKIIWNFDYEVDMFNVEWSFKNKTSSSPTAVMVKISTNAAQLTVPGFNIKHESNGNVTITSVTADNEGIYYCTVEYTAAKYPSVTGTATVNIASTTKDVTAGPPCETGCIVGICIGGAFLAGLTFGICYLCVCLKELGRGCKDIPIWVWILCPFVIGLGILTVWFIWEFCGLKKTCLKDGNGDVEPRVRTPRNVTQSGNPHTDQKKSETKKNKSKDSVAHTANEQHNQGRKQPPPPSDAGAAAGTTLNGRPMPDIPRKSDGQGHDSKRRGLSANYDDDHPLIGIDIPFKKAGALGSLPEGTGGEGPVKKLKKKKKKSKEDQEDEV